ncbi:MAG: hypothetical protein M3O31_02115 [Acidobacteriota bacterium]|nr:hypothetical protein [Acidobacteriota bacterium]
MSVESIIVEIDLEIGRLQQAKQLLGGTVDRKGPRRPRGTTVRSAPKAKRTMSRAARAKIAAAQKARWAKARKAGSTKTAVKADASK